MQKYLNSGRAHSEIHRLSVYSIGIMGQIVSFHFSQMEFIRDYGAENHANVKIWLE